MTMRTGWLKKRSLKFRLSLWFTLVTGAIALLLVPLAYSLIKERLFTEVDRDLRVDWDLIEAHLESDPVTEVRWRRDSPATPKSRGYAGTSFDVWSDSRCHMIHRAPDGRDDELLPPPVSGLSSPYSLIDQKGERLRCFQKNFTVEGREHLLRVFRDESGIHESLHEILSVLVLGIPASLSLAAVGGYFLAGRSLAPIDAMATKAREISSDSLCERLPNPNPHNELGQLATVFNQTLERLECSFKALRRFTADASHELRTPLTALRSVGEASFRVNANAEQLRESLASMLEEGQRMSDLIDTLLMFARIEGGQSRLEGQVVEIDALVSDLANSLRVLALEKDQTLRIVCQSVATVVTSPQMLRQALSNVIHNAICHSPDGATIKVKTCLTGDEVQIEVRDDGPGISPEHQSAIFERFYRVDQARSRNEGGTGLGLAIAKLSIQQLGGKISLISTPGEGALFRLSLPRSPETGSRLVAMHLNKS